MKEDELKKALGGLLKTAKEKRELEDAARKEKNEEDRRNIFESVGKDLGGVMQPFIDKLQANSQMSAEELKRIISEAVHVEVPSIDTQGIQDVLAGAFANLVIPTPKVSVTVPPITVPEAKVIMPESMKVNGEVDIAGVDNKHPFPVIMMGVDGKPAQFSTSMGGGGGRGDFFTIKDIQNSSGGSIIDAEGNVKVAGSFSVTASNSSTHILDASNNIVGSVANPLNVAITSGAASSTKAQIGNSDGDYSAANPLPVSFSAAASQNVNVFDGQASTVTSHQGHLPDFRGLDVTVLRTVNVESVLNSSTATLGIGGVFTGLAEEVKDFATIQLTCFSDVASATDGLSIQQSSDGSNWDLADVYTSSAGTTRNISMQVAARYFRVVYTNGGTGQASFRLYVVFHQNSPKSSSQRPSDGASNENDFEQNWTFNSAFNGSTWDRIHTNTGDSAGAVRVTFATDAIASIATGTTGLNETNTGVLRVVQMTDSNSSVNVTTFNGNAPATGTNEITGGVLRVMEMSGNVTSANVVTFNGNAPATGLNETTSGVLRTVLMTDSISSVNVVGPVNQGDVATAIRVVQAGNVASSVMSAATGLNETTVDVIRVTVMSDTAQSSQSKLIAMTTLPTAVSDAATGFQKSDKLGRGLSRPIQVRELLATAYVTLSTGTEATLLAAVAGNYLDCIWMAFANTSSVAQQVDVRATTAGNIVHTAYIPANSTVGWAPTVPWPQDNQGNNWTVDMADVTNSNILVTALFSKET